MLLPKGVWNLSKSIELTDRLLVFGNDFLPLLVVKMSGEVAAAMIIEGWWERISLKTGTSGCRLINVCL